MSIVKLAEQPFELNTQSPLKVMSHWVQRIVTILTIVLTAIMVLDIAAQVVYRYVLDNSLVWSDELGRYLFLWSVFLGATMGIKNNSLPSFGSVVNSLPLKARSMANLISKSLILGFCLDLFILSIKLLPTFESSFSPTLQINMAYLYSIFPLFSVISILHVAAHIWEERKEITAGAWIIALVVVAALAYVSTTDLHLHLSFPIMLIVLLIILFALGVPIAFVLGLTSIGLLFLSTTNPLTIIPQRMFLISDNFSLMAIPFFMLTGSLMQVEACPKPWLGWPVY